MVSYSFHISSKSHALTNVNKLAQVSKHNLRAYTSSDYDLDQIEILVGSQNLVEDVKQVYHQEFDAAVERYNEKQKRDDRKITDYFNHVSDSRSDVAVEIIIQLGDKDFWQDKNNAEQQSMSVIFRDQLAKLQEYCPDFKVASAVIHYDESSPHMHVVGVPVAHGYKKGMDVQCAKTKVFTKESLSFLQDKMRERAEIGMRIRHDLFREELLKPKEKGRNKDIPKASLDEFYKIKKDLLKNKEAFEKVKNVISKREALIDSHNEIVSQYNNLLAKRKALIANIERLEGEVQELSNAKRIMAGELDNELTQARFMDWASMPFGSNFDQYIDKGELLALYQDGTTRQVTHNPKGGWDYKTLEDQNKGLCRVGFFKDEARVKVPKSLLTELIQVRDKNVAISQNLQNLINQQATVKKALKKHKNNELDH